MNKQRNDFTVRPNRQTDRLQTDLWDVVVGRVELVTTAQSQALAQDLADRLNVDPWALGRGQTRAEMYGAVLSTPRDD